MATKFKIFEGSPEIVETQLSAWIEAEEPKGCMSIYDIHFAGNINSCMVLIHYTEWEKPSVPENSELNPPHT